MTTLPSVPVAADIGPTDPGERWKQYRTELGAGFDRRKLEAARRPPLPDGRHDPLFEPDRPDGWQCAREEAAFEAGYRIGMADGWLRCEVLYQSQNP